MAESECSVISPQKYILLMGKYGPRLPLSHINSKLLGTVGNYCVIAYSTPSFSKPLPAVSGEFGHEAADRQCFRSLFNMQTGFTPSGTASEVKRYRFYSLYLTCRLDYHLVEPGASVTGFTPL